MPVVEDLKLQKDVGDAFGLRVTLVGLQDVVRPVVGVVEAERVMVPL